MQAKDNPPKTSLIIPVYNQWRFTKACLEALAETIGEEDCEIIVVDNGSSDETVSDCALLGNALFSARFRYKRLNTNCNFGPASNIGAKLARGEFLLFLNNDTAPQNSWLSPLLDDFSTFPNLGATGPLLLYPETEPFGHSIQHLGVTVTPYLSVSHLYEGIPAKSPLAQKRRFFQIITAACMLIPKRTFMDAGMFDEHYINGVEDIDLCAHLFAKNLRMTVNPKALVIHHTSQTPGREKHEAENYAYFQTHCQPLLSQDMDFQVEQDGMELRLNPWLVFYPHCKQEIEQKLDLLAAKLPEEKIAELLIHEPLWENGWEKRSESNSLLLEKAKLFPSAENFFSLFCAADQKKDKRLAQFALNWACSFYKPWDVYVQTAEKMRDVFAATDNKEVCALFSDWLTNANDYKKTHYEPFIQKMEHIMHGKHMQKEKE